MKLSITVKPNAKHEKVEQTGDLALDVWVKEPAKEGRANEAVLAVVADYVGVSKSRVRLLSGMRGKKKIVEVVALQKNMQKK